MMSRIIFCLLGVSLHSLRCLECVFLDDLTCLELQIIWALQDNFGTKISGVTLGYALEPSTCLCDISQIPGIIKPHGGKGRPPVSLDKQLLLTLKYLGTQETCHVLAEKFNLSPSTCSDIVKRI